MPVKETSVWAYREHLLSGAARIQRDRVYLAMLRHHSPLTRNTIEMVTGIRINAVCGRVKELLDMEVIEVSHKAVDPNGYGKTPVEYLKCSIAGYGHPMTEIMTQLGQLMGGDQ